MRLGLVVAFLLTKGASAAQFTGRVVHVIDGDGLIVLEGDKRLNVLLERRRGLWSQAGPGVAVGVYKFFVNALYVALTRAVPNVYVIEADTSHPLLRLLGLEDARERLDIAEQKSTLEEWQYEAHRLEQQAS